MTARTAYPTASVRFARDLRADRRLRAQLRPVCQPGSAWGAESRNPRVTRPAEPPSADAGDPRPPADLIRQIDLIRDPSLLERRRAARAKAAAEHQARVDALAAIRQVARNVAREARATTRVCPECHLHLPTGTDVCDTCGETDGWGYHHTDPSYDVVELD